jgi:hypothetical protein
METRQVLAMTFKTLYVDLERGRIHKVSNFCSLSGRTMTRGGGGGEKNLMVGIQYIHTPERFYFKWAWRLSRT